MHFARHITIFRSKEQPSLLLLLHPLLHHLLVLPSLPVSLPPTLQEFLHPITPDLECTSMVAERMSETPSMASSPLIEPGVSTPILDIIFLFITRLWPLAISGPENDLSFTSATVALRGEA